MPGTDEQTASAGEVEITVGSVQIGGSGDGAVELHSVVVDLDLNQPDMCAITANNKDYAQSKDRTLGDAVEVKMAGKDGNLATIFKGELVGVEPFYEVNGESRCVLRAFNRMHRLTRGRKSRTWQDRTDQQIASDVATDAGLSADSGSSPSITHKHVYQHNQTNLEFLRVRAARLGFEVWVDDTTLYFKKPDRSAAAVVKLKLGTASAADEVDLKTFAPRLSAAGIVTEVKVRGWDPEAKEAIEGSAAAQSSPLGSSTGASKSSPFGSSVVSFEVDHPIFSKDEADAIAKSRLEELLMDYISGEGTCRGDPRIKPGVIVEIDLEKEVADPRFSGKYLVVGATHVFSKVGGGKDNPGGSWTTLRVRRDAEGG